MAAEDTEDRVAQLSPDVGEDLRYDILKAHRLLREVEYPEGALDVLMRPALRLTERLFLAVGKRPGSDNLFDRVEEARRQGLIPDEIASYLHFVRTFANKPHHAAEGMVLRTTDADHAFRSLLRVMEWFYCEAPDGPHLATIYLQTVPASVFGSPGEPAPSTEAPAAAIRPVIGDVPLTPVQAAQYMKTYREQVVAEMNNNLVLELYDRPHYEDVCITPLLLQTDTSTGQRATVDVTAIAMRHRSVILGEPGSGKTTALRKLALDLIRHEPMEQAPVYLSLASFGQARAQGRVSSFREFIDSEVALYGCPQLERLRAAAGVEVLFLMDGWDELAHENDQEAIRRFLHETDARFVVTARPEVQRSLPFAAQYEMLPLSRERMSEFLRLRIPRGETLKLFVSWLSTRPEMLRMAENPLNLSIMAIAFGDREGVAQLTRTELYERAFEAIVQQYHRLHVRDGNDAGADTASFELEKILQQLAYHTMVSGEGRFFSGRQLQDAAVRVLGRVPRDLARIVTNRLGIIRDRRAGRMEFFHLWYQEFLAARQIVEGEGRLVEELSRPSLATVLPFAIGLLRDSRRSFNLLMTVHIHDIFNFCRAIPEARLSAGEVEALLKRTIEHAENQQPRVPVRIELARALVRVGSGGRPGLERIALDESVSDYPRRAALEALALLPGESSAFDALLFKLLDTQILGLLWHVIEHVGLRKLQSARTRLKALATHPDPIVVGDAVWALRELDPSEAIELNVLQLKALLECLTSSNRHVQGHALRTIGRLRIRDALPLLKRYLADTEAAYRWITVEAAVRIGGPDSIALVYESLRDSDPRVVAAALQGMVDGRLPVSEAVAAEIEGHVANRTWIAHLEQPLGRIAQATLQMLRDRGRETRAERLFVARHCKTDWNLDGRLQGKVDLPLSNVGRAQAEQLIPVLRELDLDRVISSNARRAVETASVYANALGTPLESAPGLRELDHGEWEGKRFDALSADASSGYCDWLEDPEHVAIPGGAESITMAQQRIVEAVRGVVLEHRGESVLIVTHKHIRALLDCWLLGRPLSEMRHVLDDGVEPSEVPAAGVARLLAVASRDVSEPDATEA